MSDGQVDAPLEVSTAPEAVPPIEPALAPEPATPTPGLNGDDPFTPTRDEFEAVLSSLAQAHEFIEEHKAQIEALRRELHGITR